VAAVTRHAGVLDGPVAAEDGVIVRIRPRDDEGETGPRRDLEVVDARLISTDVRSQ